MENLHDIAKAQIELINDSLVWADKYNNDTFPRREFKERRRQARKALRAMQCRPSAAAYGESQVGKSYLMGSLLSSPGQPFLIENGGKHYNFVDEINPSGGNMTKIESTGVITRFTTAPSTTAGQTDNLVKIENLSLTDIILLIADSYYNDTSVAAKASLSTAAIDQQIDNWSRDWATNPRNLQSDLTDDDIRDIQEYMTDVIGNAAGQVLHSRYFDVVADNIDRIPRDQWEKVFGLMWNNNPHMSRLFNNIVTEYAKLGFSTEVFVPFDAIVKRNGTLLKIQWLDLICGKEVKDDDFTCLTTDVYGSDGRLLAKDFSKAFLSALTAEVTITLPPEIVADRPFLQHIDLLDFPGARTRLNKPEADIDYVTDMPEILRRGKVAYLFNSYVRSGKITSLLFCHHNDQKTESTIGNSIKMWVEDVVGRTAQDRTASIAATEGVSPLFMVATKFNIDLARSKDDQPGALTNHWRRFTDVIPEIIGSYQWFDNWTEQNGRTVAFRNIFPLRDFFWSSDSGAGKSNLFSGYNDGSTGAVSPETGYALQPGFPDYFTELRESFLNHPFVKSHFESPTATWDSFATVCNDGSRPIIEALSRVAPCLTAARDARYTKELKANNISIVNSLGRYYEPEDDTAKAEKTKKIAARLRGRMFMTVGAHPEVFGRIIDSLMIDPETLRRHVSDIIVLRTETPRDFSAINFLRANVGIAPGEPSDSAMRKLMDFFGTETREELEEEFAGKDFTVDEIISGSEDFCATEAEIVAKRIINVWIEHLNDAVASLSDVLPFTDEIIGMFQTLVSILGIRRAIADRVSDYQARFDIDAQLNAISDFAALSLNNFVSTVGRKQMTDDHLRMVSQKAQVCNIPVDLSPDGIEPLRQAQPLTDVLDALDRSTEIMGTGAVGPDEMAMLRRLPLWDNFHRWQNLLLMGLILSSGVSSGNLAANSEIKTLIDRGNHIFE